MRPGKELFQKINEPKYMCFGKSGMIDADF